MDQQTTSATSGNGASTHDLFALTDEQILEIEPEPADEAAVGQPFLAVQESAAETGTAKTYQGADIPAGAVRNDSPQITQAGVPVQAAPPAWLAAQMKDPWTGQEAQELWNGVQQAKSEAAAYRAAFATPEDARALKELYPGGVNEARAAAERARVLDDIDRAYFGAAGGSAEQTSAARTQLAQRMLREDPAAFREMVFAGLRALEESAGVGATLASPGGVGVASANEAHVAAYAAFEKAANEDLERSVGGAIERTMQHALPNLSRTADASAVGAQHAAPLQTRLTAAVRQDVETALKGDRQLSEQIAQILSARRFDNETRAQVVRLIGERAQQLVPGATKRVLNEWTQATLASHRGRTARADAATARREVAPASGEPQRSIAGNQRGAGNRPARNDTVKAHAARVDYRKLSDEQILDL